MTDSQLLTDILKHLEAKGWDFWGYKEICKNSNRKFFWEADNSPGCGLTVEICHRAIFSIPDLLADHSVWKVVCSEKDTCISCGSKDIQWLNNKEDSACKYCGYTDVIPAYPCKYCGYTDVIPAYLYHIAENIKLPTISERLKHLWELSK